MADPVQEKLGDILTTVQLFNQRSLAKEFGLSLDGHCHAMCLDWIRRSLQLRNRSRSMVFSFDDDDKRSRTVRRQVEMQDKLGQGLTALRAKQRAALDKATSLNQKALDAQSLAIFILKTLQQNPEFESFFKEDFFPQGTRRQSLNAALPGLFDLLPVELTVDDLTKVARKLKDDRLAFQAESDSLKEKAPKLLAEYSPLFRSSMETLQATLANFRSQEKSGTPSKRGFDGITIKESRKKLAFQPAQGSSALEFVYPGLKAERAAMIGFDIGDSGHEVAIRLNSDGLKFVFMDPNYGIFAGHKAKLNEAFDYLFSQGQGIYNNPGSPDGGLVKGTFDYTIFKKNAD